MKEIQHVQTAIAVEDLEKLKKLTGEKETKAALTEAIRYYLEARS